MIDKTTTVKELMTTDVIVLYPSELMEKAATIFETKNIHHIPVLGKEDQVIGMLSKAEYYKLMDAFTHFNVRKAIENNESLFRSMWVGERMAKPVVTLYSDATVEQAYSIFRENRFHALPIINKETKKLEGIITTYDLLNYAFNEPAYLATVQ